MNAYFIPLIHATFSPLKPGGCCTHFTILPTRCINGFRVTIRLKSDHVPNSINRPVTVMETRAYWGGGNMLTIAPCSA